MSNPKDIIDLTLTSPGSQATDNDSATVHLSESKDSSTDDDVSLLNVRLLYRTDNGDEFLPNLGNGDMLLECLCALNPAYPPYAWHDFPSKIGRGVLLTDSTMIFNWLCITTHQICRCQIPAIPQNIREIFKYCADRLEQF